MMMEMIRYGQKQPLVLKGKNFDQASLLLKIDGVVASFICEKDGIIVPQIPSGLTPGVKTVQVFQTMSLGGEQSHHALVDETEFLLCPVIDGSPTFCQAKVHHLSDRLQMLPGSEDSSRVDTIQLNVKPAISPYQSVVLWLNPYQKHAKKYQTFETKRSYGISSLLLFLLTEKIGDYLKKPNNNISSNLVSLLQQAFREQSMELSAKLSLKRHSSKLVWRLTDHTYSENYVIRENGGVYSLYYGLVGDLDDLWYRIAFQISRKKQSSPKFVGPPFVEDGTYLVRLQTGRNSRCESALLYKNADKNHLDEVPDARPYSHPIVEIPKLSVN